MGNGEARFKRNNRGQDKSEDQINRMLQDVERKLQETYRPEVLC